MPPPTPPAGSNTSPAPVIATDGTQLNPLAVNIAKAIRAQETGSLSPTAADYQVSGDKGESHGAYQFNKGNFQTWAKEYGLNPDDFSPVNQDKLAYRRINSLLSQGRSPSEIAAIWNGAKVENGKYVPINPAYVESVKSHYAQIVGGGAPPSPSSPTTPPPSGATDTGATPPAAGATPAGTTGAQAPDEGFLSKALDWAFPIVKDVGQDISGKSDKTGLQQLGDLGLSALWFLPGIGEGAGAAIRGAGLLGEGAARLAGHAIGGAATGYGADVASKLAQGQTDAGVLKPGVGTATGGLLGGVLGRVADRYSPKGVMDAVAGSNNGIVGQFKKGTQALEDSFAKGRDLGAFMAGKGISLAHAVNPETIAYETKAYVPQLEQDALKLNSVLTEGLAKIPGTTSVRDVEKALLAKVPQNYPERADIIRNEMALLRQQYGRKVTTAALNDWKQRLWTRSKFGIGDTPDMLSAKSAYRMMGNYLKGLVEDNASKAGLDGVKEFNDYIGSHLDAAQTLDWLSGMKAKGGRLGTNLFKMTGEILGGGAGLAGLFGGGPVGALLGAYAGHYGAAGLAKIMRKVSSSPIKSAILRNIAKEDPQVVQKIQQFLPKELQPIKAQLEGQGIPIFGGRGGAPVAPIATPGPLPSGSGLIQRALLTSGAKMATQK